MSRTLVRVLRRYKAKNESEMTVYKGEVFEQEKQDDEYSFCFNACGMFGKVKLSNLEILTGLERGIEWMKLLTDKLIYAQVTNSFLASSLREALQKLLFMNEDFGSPFAVHVFSIIQSSKLDCESKVNSLRLLDWVVGWHVGVQEKATINFDILKLFLKRALSIPRPEHLIDQIITIFTKWCTNDRGMLFESERKQEVLDVIKEFQICKDIDHALTQSWLRATPEQDEFLSDFVKNFVCFVCLEKAVNYLFEISKRYKSTAQRESFEFCDFTSFVAKLKMTSSAFKEKFKEQEELKKNPSLESVKSLHSCNVSPGNIPQITLAVSMDHFLQTLMHTKLYLKEDVQIIGLKIGLGGESQGVYRVRTRDNHTIMVMKEFNQQFHSYMDNTLKEFMQLFESGNHTNIVQMYGLVCKIFQDPSPYAILIEYMELGSLNRIIHTPEFNYGEKEVLDWSLQAAGALLHLHSKGLIHRDIKPGNCLMTRRGSNIVLKLGDFGMVKKHHTLDNVSDPKSLFGTEFYIAPEGDPRVAGSYTSAVDIYSFGITIWEMAQRKAPFHLANLVYVDENLTIRRPSMENPAFSWLSSLVEPMWAQNPSDRPKIGKVYKKLRKLYEKCEVPHCDISEYE